MLEIGKCYRNNNGNKLRIGGQIRDYSADQPWVWSISGDWYHEQTGQFISYSGRSGTHSPLPADSPASISNHNEVKD